MYTKDFFQNINHLSGNRLSILQSAIKNATDKQAVQASVLLAYYTFFSIFPVLLVMIAGRGYFLDNRQVFKTVAQYVQRALPISNQVINENPEEILEARGSAAIVCLSILWWFASGIFTHLAKNINLTRYHSIPTLCVWRSVRLWGARIASLAWKAITTGFSWYLGTSFGQYQLADGSLGAITAFLFLICFVSLITRFGAHLSAAIESWESDRLSAATT